MQAERKMAVQFVSLTLVLLAAIHTNGKVDILINVQKNARPADCSTNVSNVLNCSTLANALNLVAEYPNLTAAQINVTYGHFLEEPVHLNDLAVTIDIFSGSSTKTITCPQLGCGVAFVNVTSVSIRSIAWNNCSIGHNTTTFLTTGPYQEYNCMRAYSALFFHACMNVNLTSCHFTSERGSGVSIYDAGGTEPGGSVIVEDSTFSFHRIASELSCTSVNGHQSCSPLSVGLYIETTYCGYSCDCVARGPIVHKESKYQILGCTFENNTSPGLLSLNQINVAKQDYHDFWPFGSGGGLAMLLRGNVLSNTVEVRDSHFYGNSAVEGGGMVLQLFFHPEANNVTIRNCSFANNNATDSGGGLRLGLVFIEVGLGINGAQHPGIKEIHSLRKMPQPTDNNDFTSSHVLVELTNFTTNYATTWGGGMSAYGSLNNVTKFTLQMTNCSWLGNMASNSAPALGLTLWEEQMKYTEQLMDTASVIPTCSVCNILHNKIMVATSGSHKMGYGAVFLQGIPMSFTDTVFASNSESALCISSTTATFSRNITFVNNHGLVGGGIYMLGMSQILLTESLVMQFINNTAFQHGGGLYYTVPPSLSLSHYGNCFMKYLSESGGYLPYKNWSARITFHNNTADQHGHSVYISSPLQCTFDDHSNPFNTSSSEPVVTYSPSDNLENAVSTPPYNILFPGLNKTDDLYADWYTYRVQPGRAFEVSVQVLDYFNNPTISSVSVRCHTPESYVNYAFSEDQCGMGGRFSLPEPSREFTLNDSLSSLRLMGPQKSKVLLVFKASGLQPVVIPLLVELKKCDLGYLFDEGSMSCGCFASEISPRNVLCFDTTQSQQLCIRRGYWYGKVSTYNATNEKEHIYGIQTCLFDTCSDACTSCSGLEGWCELPQDSEVFCKHGRRGVLCSECKENLTLSYDSYSCTSCSPGKAVGLVGAFLLYWLAVLAEVFVIMRIDFRIGSGYTYCFLYYFSVVKYVLYYNLPQQVEILFYTFGSLARLDPLFLVYSRLCFSGVSSLQYEMLHYLHPAVILLVIGGLILLSKVCPRVQIISGSSAIQALCFVFIVAYTSVAETSLNILNPIRYLQVYPQKISGLNATFVLLQPTTPYLHPTEHLPYFLVAVLFEVIVVFPFAIFMLLAPWISRKVNLIKVKPILDEYQSCYKAEYRWFAGVYLIGRQVFFVTSIWVIDLYTSILLNQVFCICILLLHAFLQPYRKRWLNILDTVLLLDLAIVALLYDDTGIDALSFKSKSRNAFITILILIPSLYAVIGIGWEAIKLVLKCACCRGVRGRMQHMAVTTTSEAAVSDLEESLPPRLLEEELLHHPRSNDVQQVSPSASPGNETRPLIASRHSGSSSDDSGKWYQRIGNLIPRRRDSNRSGNLSLN